MFTTSLPDQLYHWSFIIHLCIIYDVWCKQTFFILLIFFFVLVVYRIENGKRNSCARPRTEVVNWF